MPDDSNLEEIAAALPPIDRRLSAARRELVALEVRREDPVDDFNPAARTADLLRLKP